MAAGNVPEGQGEWEDYDELKERAPTNKWV
jgi:hypothetical protein